MADGRLSLFWFRVADHAHVATIATRAVRLPIVIMKPTVDTMWSGTIATSPYQKHYNMAAVPCRLGV